MPCRFTLLHVGAMLALAFSMLPLLLVEAGSYPSQTIAGGCQMAYMSPHYISMDGMNASHSRLAKKYSLHLYREAGYDLDIGEGVSLR